MLCRPLRYDPAHGPAIGIEVMRVNPSSPGPVMKTWIGVNRSQPLCTHHVGVAPPLGKIARVG
ncbi:MAG TPA: hypothetical protein ACFYEH_01690 [Candidatus Brocadiaceae bacterium]